MGRASSRLSTAAQYSLCSLTTRGSVTAAAASARQVAGQLEAALDLGVDLEVLDPEQEWAARRRLAAKDGQRGWDILPPAHGAQSADDPPLELHRAFVARTGELRSGRSCLDSRSCTSGWYARPARRPQHRSRRQPGLRASAGLSCRRPSSARSWR